MHQTTCVFLPSPRFFALGDGHSDLGRTRRNAITPHFTQRSFLRCPRLSRRLGTPKEDVHGIGGETLRVHQTTLHSHTCSPPLSPLGHDIQPHPSSSTQHRPDRSIILHPCLIHSMVSPFSLTTLPHPPTPCLLFSPRRGQSTPPR